MISYIQRLNDGNNFKSISKNDFITRLNNKLSTYEYTGDKYTKVKPYFDIDFYVSHELFDLEIAQGIENYSLHLMKETLKEYVTIEPNICVATSHGIVNETQSKYSIRFYISNLYTNKPNNKLFVMKLNKIISNELWDYVEKPKDGKLFDTSVYDDNKKMRCINTSKEDEDRPLILKIGNIEQSVITEFFDDDAIELPAIEPQSPTSVIDIYSNDVQIKEDDIYYKYLNCIGNKMCDRGQHKETITILQILKNENVDIEHVKYWIHRYAYPNSKKYSYAIEYYQNDKYIKYSPLDNEKRLTIKSLKYYAKQHNQELYSRYFKDDYEYRLKKLYSINNIITDYQDEKCFMELYFNMKNDRVKFINEKIYLYYNDEWNVMNEKGRMLKNDMIELFDTYIKCCFDILNEEKKKNINNSEELAKLKKIDEKICKMNSSIKKENYINHIFNLLLNKLASIKSSIVFDIGTDNHYNIHFKNGVYDLKIKKFRSRIETDYVTKFLNYDYIEDQFINETIKNDVYDFFKKIQPNEDQRKFTLSYLAYCLTGNATKQIFKMNIGHTASNGKSTELSIHEKCFDIYTEKMDNRVLLKNFDKRHKYLVDLIHNPIRLVFFEEMPKGKKLDVEFIKDFVDGKKLSCEIMFGTNEKFNVQAKLMSVSNHDFECDTDEGILRRGRVQFYESKFVNETDMIDETQHIYKKEEGYENKFDDVYYKNAYFHLLLRYVDELVVPKKNQDDFKQTAEQSDDILNNIFECFEITNNKEHKISKKEIEILFGKDKFADYKAKLQSKGCKYESQEKIKYEDKWISGVFVGIQKI